MKTPFLWIPGQGCDRAALARMRRSFPRPREPMGEAWFMGETRALFWELLGDLDTLSMEHLGPALYEIGSGTKNLGERNEWTDWFHYILAQTLPRAHETYAFHSLVESLATTFFLLYPEDISREHYKGFRRDALDTLGRSMMNAECWDGDRVRIGAFLHRYYNEQAGAWFWRDASGDFAASMFFCLKYLGSEEVAPWLRSVLAITDPHWRSQIIVWFVGAHDLLAGRFLDPSGYEVSDCPSLSWEASHLLKRDTRDGVTPHFLPRPNREAALATLEAFMDDDLYLEWLCSISEFDYIESELADLPERFRELYILDAPAPL